MTAIEKTNHLNSADPNKGANVNSTTRKRSLRTRLLIGTALLLSIAGLASEGHHRFTHISTDDARIVSDMVVISSKVAGRLTHVNVSLGESLKVGTVIAKLDSQEAELRLEEVEAELLALMANYDRVSAERDIIMQTTKNQVNAVNSLLIASKAKQAAAAEDLKFNEREWGRSNSLKSNNIISDRQWENDRKLWRKSQQEHLSAEADVSYIQSELLKAKADTLRPKVLSSELERLSHESSRLKLQVARQHIVISEHSTFSPINGVVDKIFVDAGEYVIAGQRLLLLHSPDNIWIDANIKETQIRHIGIGDSVDIHVDAYPDKTFSGEVVHIGHTATNQFSLLPSTNPSGNFTKVTQRVPIRISIQQFERLLKPGMMVEVDIDIR